MVKDWDWRGAVHGQRQQWKLEEMECWGESSGEIHSQQEKKKQTRMKNNQQIQQCSLTMIKKKNTIC